MALGAIDRLGHELVGLEFVVLLPETGAAGAVAAADKLRADLAGTDIAVGETRITVRASVGAAAWNTTMSSAADLYSAADRALYRAKDLGRDRTELHDPLAARS